MQGLKASLLGAIPYSAVRLGSYDGLKWAYKKVSTPSEAILTDMPYAPACSLSNQRGEGLTPSQSLCRLKPSACSAAWPANCTASMSLYYADGICDWCSAQTGSLSRRT